MNEIRLCVLCLALVPVAIHAQGNKPSKNLPWPRDQQLSLRARLLENPHDKDAHTKLIAMLRAKYAFRAQMEEDGEWLKNNPEDYAAEIEMNSTASTAVRDPEYAIAIERYILVHANRADYPEGYDGVIDHLAMMLSQREKYEESLALRQQAVRLTPNNSGVWENLGDGQVQSGDLSGAITSYKKSLDLDSNQEGPHDGLAKAYTKRGDYVSAETELTAALAIYNSQYHSNSTTDSYHEAMKKIQQVTKIEPELAEMRRALASVYVADGKFERALAETKAASEAADPYSDYYLQAQIYDAWGKPQQAAEMRAKAHESIASELKKEKTSSQFFDEFSFPELVFITTSPGDGDERAAREIVKLLAPLRESGRLKPMDHLMLGFSYCDLGQYQTCKTEAETGLAEDPKLNTATLNHTFGRAMLKGHEPAAALAHFRTAYEMDPANITYRMDYEEARGNR